MKYQEKVPDSKQSVDVLGQRRKEAISWIKHLRYVSSVDNMTILVKIKIEYRGVVTNSFKKK